MRRRGQIPSSNYSMDEGRSMGAITPLRINPAQQINWSKTSAGVSPNYGITGETPGYMHVPEGFQGLLNLPSEAMTTYLRGRAILAREKGEEGTETSTKPQMGPVTARTYNIPFRKSKTKPLINYSASLRRRLTSNPNAPTAGEPATQTPTPQAQSAPQVSPALAARQQRDAQRRKDFWKSFSPNIAPNTPAAPEMAVPTLNTPLPRIQSAPITPFTWNPVTTNLGPLYGQPSGKSKAPKDTEMPLKNPPNLPTKPLSTGTPKEPDKEAEKKQPAKKQAAAKKPAAKKPKPKP